jgi:hypothetical protein
LDSNNRQSNSRRKTFSPGAKQLGMLNNLRGQQSGQPRKRRCRDKTQGLNATSTGSTGNALRLVGVVWAIDSGPQSSSHRASPLTTVGSYVPLPSLKLDYLLFSDHTSSNNLPRSPQWFCPTKSKNRNFLLDHRPSNGHFYLYSPSSFSSRPFDQPYRNI